MLRLGAECRSIDIPLVVNSQGYIYRNTKDGMMRINQAKVTLYKFNKKIEQYELFESSSYNKENPQTTQQDGAYSFLALEGTYYIAVQAKDYQDYKSEEFNIKDGEPINFNIELKQKFDWLNFTSWVVGVAVLFISGVIDGLQETKTRKYRNNET